MVKPFNKLSGPLGALVVLERAIGQQNKQWKEKRHVNVRTPVPEIEQGTPYPPEGGGLQSPCFDHVLCRLDGVTLRRQRHRVSVRRPVRPVDRIPRDFALKVASIEDGALLSCHAANS